MKRKNAKAENLEFFDGCLTPEGVREFYTDYDGYLRRRNAAALGIKEFVKRENEAYELRRGKNAPAD